MKFELLIELFAGLMMTSLAVFRVMHLLHFTIHIREVCVFLAPLFSALTAIATYLLTKELSVSLLFFIK